MRRSPAKLGVKVGSLWEVECWRKGELAWLERIKNLVVADGLNTVMPAARKTGSLRSRPAVSPPSSEVSGSRAEKSLPNTNVSE